MRVLLGLFLSLALHIFLVVSLQWIPIPPPATPPLEIAIIEDSSQNKTRKQFVEGVDLPKSLQQTRDDDPTKFLSAQKQRVEKETRAAVTGATKNRSNAREQEDTPRSLSSIKRDQLNVDPRRPNAHPLIFPEYNKSPILVQKGSREKNGINENPSTKTSSGNKNNSSPQLERGVSTLGEVLPTDIEIGSFTSLNTDRHLYYTFFSRINEMIRFRWESSVRSAINTTPPDRFRYNPLGLWTTQLEVVLNSQGVIKEVVLMKSSGFKGFDEAAAYAFRDSQAFFNPPIEMIDKETGEIRLKYSFQVNFEPKVLVKTQ